MIKIKKYKTVLADPPWMETGGGKIKRGADKHYSLMKVDKVIEYMKKIPFNENCHLYLWVTNNFLEKGLRVIKELGFKYKTNIVWVKDRIGLGQYFRGQHELLLFGVKGNLSYKHKENPSRSCCVESTVINAKRKKHSQKPTVQYFKIKNTSYPPYLEVFARERRENWDSWGEKLIDTVQRMLKVGN